MSEEAIAADDNDRFAGDLRGDISIYIYSLSLPFHFLNINTPYMNGSDTFLAYLTDERIMRAICHEVWKYVFRTRKKTPDHIRQLFLPKD